MRTGADGTFTYERLLRAEVRAVEVQLGTLTTPDLDITDDTYGTSLVSDTAIATDSVYFPAAVCMGVLKVQVTDGGDTKSGRIVVLYD